MRFSSKVHNFISPRMLPGSPISGIIFLLLSGSQGYYIAVGYHQDGSTTSVPIGIYFLSGH